MKEVILKSEIEKAARVMQMSYENLRASISDDYKAGYFDAVREYSAVLRAATPIMKTTDDFLKGFNNGIKIEPLSGA